MMAAETHLVSKPRLAVPAAPQRTPHRYLMEVFCGFEQALRIVVARTTVGVDTRQALRGGRISRMREQRILGIQVLVLTTVGSLDVVLGVGFSFYNRYPYFDVLVHILGGVWAGLFAAWALSHRPFRFALDFWQIVAAALCAGIVWEVFEAYVALTTFPADTFDTIKDLIDDAIGGVIAAYISGRWRR